MNLILSLSILAGIALVGELRYRQLSKRLLKCEQCMDV